MLKAHAALTAAERECLAAAVGQAAALKDAAGLSFGALIVFHAVPRGAAVWDLDEEDCSLQDAVLEAVDLADVSGRRVRLTRAGLAPLAADLPVPAPACLVDQAGVECFDDAGWPGRPDGCGARPTGPVLIAPVGPDGDPDDGSDDDGADDGRDGDPDGDPDGARRVAGAGGPELGGALWQNAVLSWVDLHRALACWTGRALAANLVLAPDTGDVASLKPFYCPDRGQDFEVVTSLRVAPESVPVDDLEAALVNVLDESRGVNADLVELDLKLWLQLAGLAMPGFAAHAPGECEGSAED